MRAYVINLERRPDRRADMERQAVALGLEFEFVPAIDARKMTSWAKLPGGVTAKGIGWADGDLACALSHRSVWQSIVDRGEPYAAIFEDDVRLSPDTRAFLADHSWIPPGEGLIKLERRGRRRRQVSLDTKTFPSPGGRQLVRFHTRYLGAAAYLVSRETAAQLLEATRVLSIPVDHLLFSPERSPYFSRLRPLALEPALCEQRPEVASDIMATRRYSWGERLTAVRLDIASLPFKTATAFRHGIGQLTGRMHRQRMTFR